MALTKSEHEVSSSDVGIEGAPPLEGTLRLTEKETMERNGEGWRGEAAWERGGEGWGGVTSWERNGEELSGVGWRRVGWVGSWGGGEGVNRMGEARRGV